MQMFKKSVALVLSVLMLLSMFSVAIGMTAFASEGYKVTVQSTQGLYASNPSKTYKAGDQFDVTFKLKAKVPLLDGTFNILFDADALVATKSVFSSKIIGSTNSGAVNDQANQKKNGGITPNFSFKRDAEAPADYTTEDVILTVTFTVQDAIKADQIIKFDVLDLFANTSLDDWDNDIVYFDVSVFNPDGNESISKSDVSGSATLSDPVSAPTEPATTVAPEPTTTVPVTGDYYVAGNMNSWKPNASYKLSANSEKPGEYMLLGFTAKADQGMKIAFSSDGANFTKWYPDGMGNDYEFAADGTYNVYFNPEKNTEWTDNGGYFYVEKVNAPEPTTLAPEPTTEKPEPTTVAPSDKVTIVFANNKKWETVKLYAYSTAGGEMTPWSGTAMTKTGKQNDYGEDLYSLEIDAKYDKIVFNNGKSGNDNQTVDVTVDPNAAGYYITDQASSGKWNVKTWTNPTPEPTTEKVEPTTKAPEPTTLAPEPTTKAPEPTTKAPEPETYTFYYLPSAAQEDAGNTYKLNYQSADGKWHNYTFTKTPVIIDKVNLYSVSVPKSDTAVQQLQYQVYNGDTWLSQNSFDNVNLEAYDNKVVKADGTIEPEKPTEAPTTAAPEATTAAPEATTAAPEATTAAPEATTAAPEATTAAPEATTAAPTEAPTEAPTVAPTEAPTAAPTEAPTKAPTPTVAPSKVDFNKPVDEASAVNAIEKAKSDADPKGSKFSALKAKVAKTTKNSNKVTWNKVSGAKKYIVMGNKCGKTNGKINSFKRLKTTKGTSFNQTKLKKGTYYKYLILAVNAKGKVISASKVIHVATKGGKVTNYKSLKGNKKSVSLKKGKTFKFKVKKKTKMDKKGKVKNHRKIMFESADTKIATVNSKGKIKAKKKGTTYIYAYAQNGVFAKIKVKVK